MFPAIFDPDAMSREEFDFYFLNATCDATYPHHEHLIVKDGMRSITDAQWCCGIPADGEFDFPIEKECGS